MFILTGIVVGLLAAAVLYYGVPLVWATVMRIQLKRRVTRLGRLVITFDDGPGDRLTPAILDLLRDEGIKVTFFLLGRNIRGREDVVRRIVAEGHEIASHGYGHLHYWKTGPSKTIRDIKDGWNAIDMALGRSGSTYPFRPPYGKLNIASLLYLYLHRTPIVYWTCDAGDTWPVALREAQSARAAAEIRSGVVVLLHDFDRVRTDVDTHVLESVRRILRSAESMALPSATVSGILHEQ